MTTPQALATYNKWVQTGVESTGLLMQPGLSRYKGTDGHIYELETADKEMSDGGLTGWTCRVVMRTKVPMGFWRILGTGRIHTYPAFYNKYEYSK